MHFESVDLLIHAELVETGHAATLLPDLVWVSRRPAAHVVALPGDLTREVFRWVRAGAETRPVLVELRSVLDEVAQLLASTWSPQR